MSQRWRMRPTTLEAGESVRKSAHVQRDDVLDYIRRRGNSGATRDEISVALHLPIQSTTFRVRELILDGDIRETKATRPTRTGREAFVLVAEGHRAQLSLFQ